MTDLLGLRGKVALILGGGQGLGEASALMLAQAGCAIAVVDMDAARAQSVCVAVRALGVNAAAIIADVLDASDADRVIAATEAQLGGLDILVTIPWGRLELYPQLRGAVTSDVPQRSRSVSAAHSRLQRQPAHLGSDARHLANHPEVVPMTSLAHADRRVSLDQSALSSLDDKCVVQ